MTEAVGGGALSWNPSEHPVQAFNAKTVSIDDAMHAKEIAAFKSGNIPKGLFIGLARRIYSAAMAVLHAVQAAGAAIGAAATLVFGFGMACLGGEDLAGAAFGASLKCAKYALTSAALSFGFAANIVMAEARAAHHTYNAIHPDYSL